MGFDFSGHVLRAPRTATTNAPSTGEPTNGVLRDVRPVPGSVLPSPNMVDLAADQYRAAILEAPGTTPQEYLVWAQNTSNLARFDDDLWWVDTGTGSIPTGEQQVEDLTPDPVPVGEALPEGYGFFPDGTSRIILTDDGNRDISRVQYVVIARGDIDDYSDQGWVNDEMPGLGRKGSNPYLWFFISQSNQTPETGVVEFNASQLVALGGGVSQERGDAVVDVRYTLAPSRFWWTRNDRYDTRFGFNNGSQKWEPYKGTPPQNLGPLDFDATYQLAPWSVRLPRKSFLPGNGAIPDSYAMLRLGVSPDRNSTPAAPDGTFTGIQVRSDYEVEQGFDFSLFPDLTGVVGQVNGVLAFNPAFVSQHVGKTLWFVYRGFDPEGDEIGRAHV